MTATFVVKQTYFIPVCHVITSRRSAMMNSLKTFATGALRAANTALGANNSLLTAARTLPAVQSKGMFEVNYSK